MPVPLPASMSENDLAAWLLAIDREGIRSAEAMTMYDYRARWPSIADAINRQALAVLSLVEAKVREAVELAGETEMNEWGEVNPTYSINAIVAKVLS